jgi:hypothetical protein
VGCSRDILHETLVHNGDQQSFLVRCDTWIFAVDVGADPTAAMASRHPNPVLILSGQDDRSFETLWLTRRNVEEPVGHTDMTSNTHDVEFDGRGTIILDFAGMSQQQARVPRRRV